MGPYQVMVSCFWYEHAARDSIEILPGPCQQTNEYFIMAVFTIDSCEHLIPITSAPHARWFASALANVNKTCNNACPNTDDVLDLHPLKGRKVMKSPHLGQGKHCFELDNLFLAIGAKPQDPLRSQGDTIYTLDMLHYDMTQFACVAI